MAKAAFISALLVAIGAVQGSPIIEETGTGGNVTANSRTAHDLTARVLRLARAVGETVNVAAVARFDNSNYASDGVGDGVDQYVMHWGAGRANEGWPQRSQWVSFENMFNNNKNNMFSSCENQWGVPNDSGPEIGAIWNSIQTVSDETGVDHRFILAVVLQESSGCVRAPSTASPGSRINNPGLMQSHNGPGYCNDNEDHYASPCPDSVIAQMICDGTAGTDDGDGLANCINEAGVADDQAFYKAARIYNSGSVDCSTRLECGIATHCYASDIANRLTGWVDAPRNCPCDDNPASCNCAAC